MNAKRTKTEEYIIKYIDKIAKGGQNKELYMNLFKSMNDKQFDEFMTKLKNKKATLSIVVPTGGSVKVSVGNNIKIGNEIGFDFFQNVKVTNSTNLPDYITPNKYLVYKLPIRRASQLLSKKISIPADDKHIDLTTGQVSGKSKSSKLTMPETQILLGMGLKYSILELMKTRGGDMGEANAMNNLLYREGVISRDTLAQYSTGVQSTKTLKSYLNAMHIKSTL